MSGITVRRAFEREENEIEESEVLVPERHDSKVVNNDGTGDDSMVGMSQDARADDARASAENATTESHPLDIESIIHAPLAYRSPHVGLSIHTDMQTPAQATMARLKDTPIIFETPVNADVGLHHVSTSPSAFPILGSSLRSTLSTSSMASSISQGSVSPYLAAMTDITPLPSPLMVGESPGSWRKSLGLPGSPSRSRAGSIEEAKLTSPTSPASAKRRKGYGSLLQEAMAHNVAAVEENTQHHSKGHGRNRSISDFVPEPLHNFRHRHVTFGPGDTTNFDIHEHHMQREVHLAARRGLTIPLDPKQPRHQLPTPPASTSSAAGESDEGDEGEGQSFLEDGTKAEYLEIHCGLKNKRRKFRQLRQLGQGTFSKVMLATRERIPSHPTPEIEEHLDPARLVAVKVIEYGPAGGADEQRIETGLKREVEMLKSVSHPSLVQLKCFEYQASRALIVLTYCPGGDLFELASQKRDVLTPHLIQRIFAEVVCAVRYLHANWIVHRDIKLENVLVNLPHPRLKTLPSDPRAHVTPLVTLTDLGLSRLIPRPPESPLLQTRCGSEDYAAPEILLGQPYDGRATDAWALGVLLYALMEGRLPFDTPPGKPERSRNTHRIARCDWIWCRFGDEDGDWDCNLRGSEDYHGARSCVEGLLKKVRMGRRALEEIERCEYVRAGIQVPGGLKMTVEDEVGSSLL